MSDRDRDRRTIPAASKTSEGIISKIIQSYLSGDFDEAAMRGLEASISERFEKSPYLFLDGQRLHSLNDGARKALHEMIIRFKNRGGKELIIRSRQGLLEKAVLGLDLRIGLVITSVRSTQEYAEVLKRIDPFDLK